MKKFFTLIMVALVATATIFPAYSLDDVDTTISTSDIEYFSNGSYAITTLENVSVSITRATSTKSGKKHVDFYNSDDELQWTVTVQGTFTYTGSSAICTSSSVSYSVADDAWKVKEAVASKSGNSAIGDFVVKRYVLLIPYQTENVNVVLTCSANGTLS